jgi:cell division protein FtsB
VHRALTWSWVPLLAWSFLFTDSGLFSIGYRHLRILELQHQLEAAELQSARLEAEADRRTDDPATIERLARERYDMAYPGESIYRVQEISSGQARRIERAQRQIEKQQEADEKENDTVAPPPAKRAPGPDRNRKTRSPEPDEQIASRPRHR